MDIERLNLLNNINHNLNIKLNLELEEDINYITYIITDKYIKCYLLKDIEEEKAENPTMYINELQAYKEIKSINFICDNNSEYNVIDIKNEYLSITFIREVYELLKQEQEEINLKIDLNKKEIKGVIDGRTFNILHSFNE